MSDEVAEVGVRTGVDERGVARIEIDRPHRMNALNTAATHAIVDALHDWANRDDIRAVVIDGVGGSFSTGADIVDIASGSGLADGGMGRDVARGIIASGSRLAGAVRAVRAPVIASIDGPAVGIGASIALASDLIYATERSYFLLAFVNIGLMPDGGASMSVATAVGRMRANELALLGEKLTAAEAFDTNLINRVVTDREALDATVERVVAKLAKKSPNALRLTKSALDAHTMAGFDAAIERELDGQTTLLQSPEFQAAMAAFSAHDKETPK